MLKFSAPTLTHPRGSETLLGATCVDDSKFVNASVEKTNFNVLPIGASLTHPHFQTSMISYKVLVAQRDALDRQILETRAREIRSAISRVRSLVMEHGIKPDDIFGKKAQRAQKLEPKSAPRYRDPASGATWAGRGKPPRWIKNKNREDFLIRFWEAPASALPKSQVVAEYFEDETRAGV